MRFKHTRTFAAVAMVLSATVATNTGAVRPEAIADGATLFTPAMTPVGLDKRPVNVVLQLRDDPVALKQAATGRKLSKAEKDAAKNALKGPQDALRGQIEAMGGTVLATYQSSYNGIKVRIAREKAAALATLPGVVAVRPLQLMKPTNVHGVPLISAPTVWQNLGLHGENIKIAVIDTGIDYTHANFGGPGTVAAYNAAFATNTAAADPALFGPAAPRVKGGIDLVGDDYNADPDADSYQPIPHPDPNPLDCVHTSGSSGHGSHVAGSAAGSGVLANGKTYTGAYNATTISGNSWTVGPGVAPKADIYSVRVFGCDGSTDVTVDAIEWAVDNDMDVINMSLGSPFGTNDDPSAVATTNAAKAGVVVVTSAGNSGPSQYIIGSPGTADGAIATAANDPLQLVQGIRINTSPGALSLQAINANGVSNGLPITGPLVVLKDDPTTTTDIPGFLGSADESLGCHPSAYTKNGIVAGGGQIAVAKRGSCARVAKAIFAQQAGAAVAVMTNNAAGLPPYEGPITSNPDTGVPFTVTIPFAGVAGNQASATTDSGKLQASPAGSTASLSVQDFANPNFTGFASFTSGGPRSDDSALKPDITGPGVSIISTASGTGNQAKVLSGTSMASPHVAGAAALTRQAHPTWKVEDIKAAIVNTGSPAGVAGTTAYRTRMGGTGLVQPAASTKSQVTANGNSGAFSVGVNFGFQELTGDFHQTKTIKLSNQSSSAATFNVSVVNPQGSPHSVNLNRTTVTVPKSGAAEVAIELNVPAATAGDASGFREVAGLIQFTPATASDNNGVALRVPYYLVPRAASDVSTTLGKLEGTDPSTTAVVTNKQGVIPGSADFYAWGLDSKKATGKGANDIRAVGVQSFPASATQATIVFAVNTYDRWSNASTNEFDIYVDVDNDGVADYIVVGADQGAVQTGTYNGIMGSFVFSTRSPGASIAFLADAASDGSTALLPVRATQLCRTGEPCLKQSNPRITYSAVSFDLNGTFDADAVPGEAKFNVWNSAISTGGFATVAPGGSDTTNLIQVNSAEWALTPALGVMVVTTDNKSGPGEAQLIGVKDKN